MEAWSGWGRMPAGRRIPSYILHSELYDGETQDLSEALAGRLVTEPG